MRIVKFFAILLGFAITLSLLSAQEPAAWPADCRIGIFLRYFPVTGPETYRLRKEFQVERIADQVVSSDADYLVLTMNGDSGWFNAPSTVYDNVTGYETDDRCSERDIPMEMADALARRGIKFFIGVTAQVPIRDAHAREMFGLGTEPEDQIITPEFARKWAEVFREWSLRYGTKVAGWWVDGCRVEYGFTEEIAAVYLDALRAGNPSAVDTFNPGANAAEWKASDFTTTEGIAPIAEAGFSRENGDTRKKHIFVCLNHSREENDTHFSADELAEWAKPAVDAGLALTFDTTLTPAEDIPGPGGISRESLEQIRAAAAAVKNHTPENAFCRAVEYDWLRQEITAGRDLESPEALSVLIARAVELKNALIDEDYITGEAAERFQKEIDAAGTGELHSLSAGQIRDRYLALRWQMRDVIFNNPLLKEIPIVFLKADRYIWQLIHEYLSYYYSHTNMTGAELMILKNPGRSFEAESVSSGKFPRGWFSTPSLSYDGKSLYFAFADFSKVIPEGTPRTTLFEIAERDHDNEIGSYLAREEGKFHLFKMNLADGSAEQLTFGSDDDFDPAELPDGDLVFMSTRRGSFARCTGGYEPVETATLHRRMKDGTVKPLSWHETNEWNPSVLGDGRIIYSRWDYVDREAARFMNLWVTNPDGTGAKALFGNYTTQVVASLQAKQIPSSNKIMFLGSGHHIAVGGPLVILDPSKLKFDPETREDELDCLEVISSDIGFPETPVPDSDKNEYYVSDHYYYSPYPLSEDFYLTAYSHDPNGGYLAHSGYGYVGSCGESYSAGKLGLYYRDRFGNLELIYADPETSCRYPIQIKARPKPPVIASQLPETGSAEGTFALSDIYDSIEPLPKDRPIKELRVFQILPHWPEYTGNVPRLGNPFAANGRAFLGTVPVEEDGSAHFMVPAGKPLYFQAVDADGRAVRTMLSEVYLQPGENRGCVGCHEQVQTASENFPTQKKAFLRAPDTLTPGPEGTAPFSFPLYVQPIIDQACISCHSGEEGSVEPDLRGVVEDGEFSNAYNNLTEYTRWYQWGGDTIAPITSRPGEGGADMSHLTKVLDDSDHGDKIGLSDADRRAFYLWMDANVPFYGTAEPETRAAELKGETVPMPLVQ